MSIKAIEPSSVLPKHDRLRAVPLASTSTPPPPPSVGKTRTDPTPTGPRPVNRSAPPPVPREAVIRMQTVELPLEEIDYDAAYRVDYEALEARLRRKSAVSDKLISVATEVRESLAPKGREEAANEIRAMWHASTRGLAKLLRKTADLLDAYA